MQVQHRARPGLTRRRQRAPPEQRVQVVGVDDVGAHPADGLRDLLGVRAAADQRPGRGHVAEAGARTLEHRDRVAPRPQQRLQIGDRPLLAALEPVTVVKQ